MNTKFFMVLSLVFYSPNFLLAAAQKPGLCRLPSKYRRSSGNLSALVAGGDVGKERKKNNAPSCVVPVCFSNNPPRGNGSESRFFGLECKSDFVESYMLAMMRR